MEAMEFSEWPGAWERHIIRRARFPEFFTDRQPPTQRELAQAQLLDKSELAQLESDLAQLVGRCSEITETADLDAIRDIKTELDRCYDMACGMGPDLNEQKEALTLLNEVITTAIRRTLREGGEHARLLLIKQESVRMRHLTRLNYPIVCDLLRPVSPIPHEDVAAAMLSESDEGFTVALEVLDLQKKQELKSSIDKISLQLCGSDQSTSISRKQTILEKTLLTGTKSATPLAESEVT